MREEASEVREGRKNGLRELPSEGLQAWAWAPLCVGQAAPPVMHLRLQG